MDIKTWYRRKNESLTCYEAFKVFRGTLDKGDEDPPWLKAKNVKDKGKDKSKLVAPEDVSDDYWRPSEPVRDLQRVSVIVQKSYWTIQQYSSRHKWSDRAYDYDLYIDERSRLAMEAVLRLKAVKWRERRVDEAEAIYREVQLIRSKIEAIGSEGLLWQTESEEVVETYPDGRTKTLKVVVNPANWAIRDMATLGRAQLEMIQYAFALMLAEKSDPKADADGKAEGKAEVKPEHAKIFLRAMGAERGIKDVDSEAG